MKLNYFPDTDSLYIDLSHKQSTESQEVSEGVVLDYDAEGNLVGIEPVGKLRFYAGRFIGKRERFPPFRVDIKQTFPVFA